MKNKIRNNSIITIFLIVIILTILSCEKGIAPRIEPPRTGFSGRVTFINNWPADVYRTHLVVFRDTLRSAADFNILNIGFVSDTIPYGVSFYDFESDKNPVIPIIPGVYKYICIAQSTSPTLSLDRKDWRVAGIYFDREDSTKYGQIEIKEGIFLKDINIKVDFNNPPIQPPR